MPNSRTPPVAAAAARRRPSGAREEATRWAPSGWLSFREINWAGARADALPLLEEEEEEAEVSVEDVLSEAPCSHTHTRREAGGRSTQTSRRQVEQFYQAWMA